MGAGEEGYPAGNPELHATSQSTKVHLAESPPDSYAR
jgi:hypothetical protein